MTNSKKANSAAAKNSAKNQTEKAWKTMMAKMTREQFAEKWKTGVCVPRLPELKTCSDIAKASADGTWTRHIYTNEDNGKTAYFKYQYLQNGLYLTIQCSIYVDGENTYNSGWKPYAKVNATKISFDYDVLDALYEEIADEMRDIDREEWVKVKFTKNADGLWDVLLPEGYKYGNIRCENTESCGKVSVGITVITIGDSTVEMELHENEEGRTVVATIQDGSATEKQVKNIIEELAEFFGCKINSVKIRKGGDDE